MLTEIITNRFTGHMSKSEFDGLPETLQQRIRQISVGIKESGKYLTISFGSQEAAENCQAEVKKCEKNRARSERRILRETWKSGGRYEEIDIEEIFNIQNGKCYYTAQPISNKPKNYAIDHITPVCSGGSSWPNNLALVLKEVNQEKHDLSPRGYWQLLKKRHGAKWVHFRKEECKKIDLKRRSVDRKRRLAVNHQLLKLNRQLGALFPDLHVSLSMRRDILTLEVDFIDIQFPKGFVRHKKRFQNPNYFEGVIKVLLG